MDLPKTEYHCYYLSLNVHIIFFIYLLSLSLQRFFGLTTLCNGSAKNRVRSCRRHAIRHQRSPTVQNITLLTNKSLVSVRNSKVLFMFVIVLMFPAFWTEIEWTWIQAFVQPPPKRWCWHCIFRSSADNKPK